MKMSLHCWKHEDESPIANHEDELKIVTHFLEVGDNFHCRKKSLKNASASHGKFCPTMEVATLKPTRDRSLNCVGDVASPLFGASMKRKLKARTVLCRSSYTPPGLHNCLELWMDGAFRNCLRWFVDLQEVYTLGKPDWRTAL